MLKRSILKLLERRHQGKTTTVWSRRMITLLFCRTSWENGKRWNEIKQRKVECIDFLTVLSSPMDTSYATCHKHRDSCFVCGNHCSRHSSATGQALSEDKVTVSTQGDMENATCGQLWLWSDTQQCHNSLLSPADK